MERVAVSHHDRFAADMEGWVETRSVSMDLPYLCPSVALFFYLWSVYLKLHTRRHARRQREPRAAVGAAWWVPRHRLGARYAMHMQRHGQ